MRKLTEGQCFNLCNGFICTEGKYQNYPCPYADQSKCPRYIRTTQDMIDQYNKKGSVIIPIPSWAGIGEPWNH